MQMDLRQCRSFRCLVSPYSPVPDIAVVALERLPKEDGPLEGAPDWLIEIRTLGAQLSPDQSMLELQNKILHCLANGTQLAWLIASRNQQIWVWQGDELPVICSGSDVLPMIGGLPELSVDAVIAMTNR
jgi:Uma2 family endonuclease